MKKPITSIPSPAEYDCQKDKCSFPANKNGTKKKKDTGTATKILFANAIVA